MIECSVNANAEFGALGPRPASTPAAPAVREGAVAKDDPGALIRFHWAGVRRYLRVLGADPATADDLAQEVFVIALRTGVGGRGAAEVAASLRATAKNLLRNDRRRRRPMLVAHLEQVWEEQERHVDRRRAALRACLGLLTDRVQRALQLAYGERRSREAIGAAIGMEPSGVKSLMRRARQTLRECIERTIERQGGAS